MHSEIIRFLREEQVALLALAVVLWFGSQAVIRVVVPRLERAGERASAVAEYDSLLAGTGDYAALRGNLTAVNDSLENRLAMMSEGMSDADDLSGLLEMLIERARKADIRFVRVQPTGQEDGEGYTMYPVLLEFATDYVSLGRFVADLESQPHVARVERLALVAERGRELNVKLLVSVFLKSTNGGG